MRFKLLFLLMVLVMLMSAVSFASDEVFVRINDQSIKNEEMILLNKGVLYGQLSDWTGRFEIDLEWMPLPQYAVVKKEGNFIIFRRESTQVTVNNQHEHMEHATFTKNGRVYVPLDYLSSLFEFDYAWDPKFHLVTIETSEKIVDQDEIIKTINYTEEDLIWLARIIDVEAGGGSLKKQTAVGNVVLNRVKSELFPNTIYDVIFANGQFPPAHRSDFQTREPRPNSWLAAKRALMGVVIAEDCLYFNNRPHRWLDQSRLFMVIEGEYFYQ